MLMGLSMLSLGQVCIVNLGFDILESLREGMPLECNFH